MAFVVHVPHAARSLNATVRSFDYIDSPEARELTGGDGEGISRDLQQQAMALIPPGSTYAVLPPANPADAARVYGIQPVTLDVLEPYLFYELLPSVQVSPATAQYVICWGCNTDPWDHRTTWLFTDPQGVAIGRVRGR